MDAENSRTGEARRIAVLEERQRLARELHDSVTQLLFSASLLADSIAEAWERDPAEGRRRSERLRELVRQALGEARALLAELAPAAKPADFSSREVPPPAVVRLHREGLVAALVHEALAHERDGLRVKVRGDGYERQSRAREEALLRVALEALANAARHARAREVTVVLACAPEEVTLVVRDDGRGFDAAAELRGAGAGEDGASGRGLGRGLGIASMRDRLRELQGTLRVLSAPGAGTTVEAKLPR